MSARAVMSGPGQGFSPPRGHPTPWAWRLVVGALQGAWYVVTGIFHALGMAVYGVCAIIEAMAVIFLLGSMGGKR